MRRILLTLLGALALGALALGALGLTLGTGLRSDPDRGSTAAAGPATCTRDEPAPALTGRTLTGQPFDLTDLRGQVVLVNALASWCAPSRQELPLLAHTPASTPRAWSAIPPAPPRWPGA